MWIYTRACIFKASVVMLLKPEIGCTVGSTFVRKRKCRIFLVRKVQVIWLAFLIQQQEFSIGNKVHCVTYAQHFSSFPERSDISELEKLVASLATNLNLIFPPRTLCSRPRLSSKVAYFKASAFPYLKVPIMFITCPLDISCIYLFISQRMIVLAL